MFSLCPDLHHVSTLPVAIPVCHLHRCAVAERLVRLGGLWGVVLGLHFGSKRLYFLRNSRKLSMFYRAFSNRSEALAINSISYLSIIIHVPL